jgi:hypothetical protein
MKKMRVIVLLCMVLGFMKGTGFTADWSVMTSGTTNNLNSIWGSSGSDVFAVGDSGTILHYDGTAWSAVASPTTDNLNSIWGSSNTHAIAVGDNGTILHYDGLNWLEAQSNTTNNLNGVWGSSTVYAFAVGDAGTFLYYYNDSWSSPMPPGTITANLNAVWGSPDKANDTYCVGDGGTIGHFGGSIPGGFMNSGTTENLKDIWGSSSSNVFAVGSNGTFLVYDGYSWSAPMAGIFTFNFNAIWGSSSSDLFVVCDGGAIGHFGGSPPGGQMDSGTTENLKDVWGSGTDVFAVGANGTILHYSSPVTTTTVPGVTTTTTVPTPPYCIAVNPQYGYAGQTLEVTITGLNTNFTDTDSIVLFRSSGITINSTTVSSPVQITANITVAGDAPPATCNVTVTTASEIVTCETAFSIIQPLANDDFDNATPITGVLFTDSIDTRGATPAADDPTDCYGTNASVWYVFTPGSDTQIQVDISYSNYYAVVAIYKVTRGGLSLIACSDYPCLTIDAIAGETYYFMVTAPYGTGGDLVLSLDVAPPPLTIDLTIDSNGLVDKKAGVTTISGMLTSSEPASAYVYVEVRQKAGRAFINGYGYAYLNGGGATPWTIQISGNIGPFKPGKVAVRAYAQGYSYSGSGCGAGYFETPAVSTKVHLKNQKK